MNLKLENPRYTTVHGTIDNLREGALTFDVDVTDLDGYINNGKTFRYTYINNVNSNQVDAFIKSKIDTLDIKECQLDPNPVLSLVMYKECIKKDIDEDFKLYTTKYDSVYFGDDLFSYDQDSINILSNIISCYDSQISADIVNKDKIVHKFISTTNEQHNLSYNELIELRNLMVFKYSEVKLHARKLKDKIENAKTIKDVKAIKWDLWDI